MIEKIICKILERCHSRLKYFNSRSGGKRNPSRFSGHDAINRLLRLQKGATRQERGNLKAIKINVISVKSDSGERTREIESPLFYSLVVSLKRHSCRHATIVNRYFRVIFMVVLVSVVLRMRRSVGGKAVYGRPAYTSQLT